MKGVNTFVAEATPEAIVRAAEIIRAGGLVAFPTETVYGLGANALDAAAAARIYEAKQRALNDPLIVHVAERDLSGLADLDAVPPERRKLIDDLMRAFWPGPLTLVLPRGAHVPPLVSAGLDTVAIRMPDHPMAQALLRASGVPIAAPSANRFGHVSPTTAQHVLDDLDGRIDMVLDGGPTRIGLESTVLDVTHDAPRILRPGGITKVELAEVLAVKDWRVEIENKSPVSNLQSLPSPGMLDKHYAPNARLLVCATLDDLLARHATLATVEGKRVGVLLMGHERAACAHIHPQFVLGDTMRDAAHSLYAGLRALDSAHVDVILVTDVPRDGLGEAVADRLKRAAAK